MSNKITTWPKLQLLLIQFKNSTANGIGAYIKKEPVNAAAIELQPQAMCWQEKFYLFWRELSLIHHVLLLTQIIYNKTLFLFIISFTGEINVIIYSLPHKQTR